MTRYNAGATARIGCCHMQTGLLVWRGANLRRALHATQPYAASGRLAGRPPAVCLHQRFTGSASDYDSAFGMRRVYFCNIFSTFFIFYLFFSHFLYASATAFLPRQQPVVVCLAFYFHSSCAQLFNDCNILHCAIVASCHKTLQPSMP